MDSRIDVITPVGRVEDYLRDAGQSIADFAALADVDATWWLVSDGPDPDWIAEQIVGLDVPVQLLPPLPDPQGPARTRNRGLRAGSAPVVAALDADDMWIPDTFATLYRDFRCQPVTWAAGHFINTDAGQTRYWYGKTPELAAGPTDLDCMRGHYREHGFFPWRCCATLVTRDRIEHVGGWDTSATFVRAEDLAMWARITRDQPGWWTTDTVMRYRAHASSITAQPSWGQLADGVAKLFDRLDDPDPSSGSFARDLAAAISR